MQIPSDLNQHLHAERRPRLQGSIPLSFRINSKQPTQIMADEEIVISPLH